jgi:hypothetical protein
MTDSSWPYKTDPNWPFGRLRDPLPPEPEPEPEPAPW